MPRLLLLVAFPLIASIALPALLAGSPRPVRACSFGIGERRIDVLAARSDAVALVEVISAGDGVNRAPPRGSAAPPLSAAAQEHLFDLTGYGARIRVVELISGSMPQEVVDVDAGVRSGLEEGLRGIEAAGNVPPCRLDSFRTRYEPGGVYAALLIERDSGWQTQIAYRVSGEAALVTHDYSPDAVSPPLTLGDGLHETFFKAIEARTEYPEGTETGPLGQVWTITADRVALSSLLDAMRAAHQVSIQPPTTGSGGLDR